MIIWIENKQLELIFYFDGEKLVGWENQMAIYIHNESFQKNIKMAVIRNSHFF